MRIYEPLMLVRWALHTLLVDFVGRLRVLRCAYRRRRRIQRTGVADGDELNLTEQPDAI